MHTEDGETARYRREARDASRDSGRRLKLLLKIYQTLEEAPITPEIEESMRLIETEVTQSHWLSERIS